MDELYPNQGTYLAVEPRKKLVWTNSLLPGFRPAPPLSPSTLGAGAFHFTGMIFLEPVKTGTRYTAMVLHGNEEHRDTHAKMGFEAGWGVALDQLITFMESNHS